MSEESEAFQECSADLIREIEEPEVLGWDLFSSNIISKKEVDEVSMVGLSAVQKKARLLSAVGDQIAFDPAKFKNLLLVLRKQPLLKDIVDKLKKVYRTHLKVGNKGRGQKGLLHCNVMSCISLCGLMPSLHTPPSEKRSGEWVEFLGFIVVRTNEIARPLM